METSSKKCELERLEHLSYISTLCNGEQAITTELQAVAVEIEETNAMFAAVQEKLARWRSTTTGTLEAIRESLKSRLSDSSTAQRHREAIVAARKTGDGSSLRKMVETIDAWLQAARLRVAEFDRNRSELQSRQSAEGGGVVLRSFGDVSAGVQQLLLVTDRHMSAVMRQCWLDTVQKPGPASASTEVCQAVGVIKNLECSPFHVTCCTNTSGYVSDNLGDVTRLRSADSKLRTIPLPQFCAFVSFGPNRVEYLSVLPIECSGSIEAAACQLKCRSHLDWSKWIVGLHCDSARQLLFVAQGCSVTVTDLSGNLKRIIDSSSLGLATSLRVADMTANSNRLLVLIDQQREILVIDKDTGSLERLINLRSFNVGGLDGLALLGSKLLLLDRENDRMHKLCGTSLQLIATYPAADVQGAFQHPWQLVVDSNSGVAFLSDRDANRVLALTAGDFQALQSLDGKLKQLDDGRAFKHPTGLALVRGAQCNALVACDWGRKCLRIYRLLF